MIRSARLAVAALALGFACAHAHAAKPPPKAKAEWNQVANVKDAAKRLGVLHRQQGAEAALKFLEACYKTHMLAEKYTQGLEACMAQDYMLSQVLAVIYSRVPEDKLKDMKAPTADVIARSMRGRFQTIFQQYKFTQEQADSLRKAVDEYGMPIFVKTVFPKRSGDKANDGKAESSGGNSEKPTIQVPLPEVTPGGGAPADAQPPAGDTK